MLPTAVTVTFAVELPDEEVAVRQRMPVEPEVNVAVSVPPELVQVIVPTLVVAVGAAPMSEAASTPHSLDKPRSSPIIAPV